MAIGRKLTIPRLTKLTVGGRAPMAVSPSLSSIARMKGGGGGGRKGRKPRKPKITQALPRVKKARGFSRSLKKFRGL